MHSTISANILCCLKVCQEEVKTYQSAFCQAANNLGLYTRVGLELPVVPCLSPIFSVTNVSIYGSPTITSTLIELNSQSYLGHDISMIIEGG